MKGEFVSTGLGKITFPAKEIYSAVYAVKLNFFLSGLSTPLKVRT